MSTYPFKDDGELVCHCLGVDSYTIKKAIYDKKLKEVEDVTRETRAGSGCMSCHMVIEQLLDEVWDILAKEGFKRY